MTEPSVETAEGRKYIRKRFWLSEDSTAGAVSGYLAKALNALDARDAALAEAKIGGVPCTACGHIIDWKERCACDPEYLGIRGGEKAQQVAIELHEVKCQLAEARAAERERLAQIAETYSCQGKDIAAVIRALRDPEAPRP